MLHYKFAKEVQEDCDFAEFEKNRNVSAKDTVCTVDVYERYSSLKFDNDLTQTINFLEEALKCY